MWGVPGKLAEEVAGYMEAGSGNAIWTKARSEGERMNLQACGCDATGSCMEHGGIDYARYAEKARAVEAREPDPNSPLIRPGAVGQTASEHVMSLPSRKIRPIVTGVLDYFPDAILEVAYCSYVGNEQHNPGQPVHWAKEKSSDEADALVRHLLERGKLDADGVRHSAKVAWRALAMLQREIDASKP